MGTTAVNHGKTAVLGTKVTVIPRGWG